MAGTTHAAVRAAERLGIIADRKWFEEVKREILSGRAKRVTATIKSLDKPTVMLDVFVSTGRARVVWKPDEQLVITVLPLELPVEHRRRLEKQDSKRKREFFRGFEGEEE